MSHMVVVIPPHNDPYIDGRGCYIQIHNRNMNIADMASATEQQPVGTWEHRHYLIGSEVRQVHLYLKFIPV